MQIKSDVPTFSTNTFYRKVFSNIVEKYFILKMLKKTLYFKILLCLFFAACESASEKMERSTQAAKEKNSDTVENAPDGTAVFRKHCVTCHGSDGKLGLNGAKDITQSKLTHAQRVELINYGKKLMTPFQKILTPAEIEAVATYTMGLKTPK